MGLTSSGEVLIWGTFLSLKSNEPVPLQVPTDKKIVFISSGSSHIALVDEDGSVFTFGEGGSWFRGGGQLGHNRRDAEKQPRLVVIFNFLLNNNDNNNNF